MSLWRKTWRILEGSGFIWPRKQPKSFFFCKLKQKRSHVCRYLYKPIPETIKEDPSKGFKRYYLEVYLKPTMPQSKPDKATQTPWPFWGVSHQFPILPLYPQKKHPQKPPSMVFTSAPQLFCFFFWKKPTKPVTNQPPPPVPPVPPAPVSPGGRRAGQGAEAEGAGRGLAARAQQFHGHRKGGGERWSGGAVESFFFFFGGGCGWKRCGNMEIGEKGVEIWSLACSRSFWLGYSLLGNILSQGNKSFLRLPTPFEPWQRLFGACFFPLTIWL